MSALEGLFPSFTVFREPAKPVRDRQRQKVYDWENSLSAGLDHSKMTWAEIPALVNEICDAYRIARVAISDGRGRRSGCYHPDFHEIRLPIFARRRDYVLHELAHAITYRSNDEMHGPRFMRVLLDLHARWSSTAIRPARAAAAKANIRVAQSKDVPTPIGARAMSRIAAINLEIAEYEREIMKLRDERALLVRR